MTIFLKYTKAVTRISSFILLLLCLAGTVTAQETIRPWKSNLELSLVNANGNTKTTSLSSKGKFTYDWQKMGLEIEAGALNTSSQEATTAEQYFASSKLTRKLTEKNYLFEKFRWDKDRFADIKNRYDLSTGLGRVLLDLPTDELKAELGGGYVWEERLISDKNDFGAGRAYTVYTRIISPTANFSQDAEYLLNLKEGKDFRFKTETALTASLSVHNAIKTSFTWKLNNKPPVGIGKSDTILSFALLITY